MSRVLVPLATGFEEIEALSIVDILRRADVVVDTAGLDTNMPVGAHGICVKTDISLSDVSSSSYDMMVLPGGLPGAEYLAKSELVKGLLQEFDKQGKYIGAICAAPWALGEAGVLKSNYTCYPSFEKTIKHSGYVESKNVVKDSNIITSRGPATAMEFALSLVKNLCSNDKYIEVKESLLA